MNHFINRKPFGRIWSSAPLVLLIPVVFAASPEPVAAHPAPGEAVVHVPVDAPDLLDERALRRVRRQISLAALELCNPGGVASIYGNAVRRCRELAEDNAERQLAERIAHQAARQAGSSSASVLQGSR